MSNRRGIDVLIIGASGVFGSRLATLAANEPKVRLTLGGRQIEPLKALAKEIGAASARQLDRDRMTAADVRDFDLVVDCAGPFQGSHTRVIEACIEAGVDYVDLADGREFVCSIGRFDPAARKAGIAVVSGASSIPALSHAVLDSLTGGWSRIDEILVGIFPGNRAPRGRSVVEAILSYVGKPVRVFAERAWREVPGWSLHRRIDCAGAGKRWASVCDTPEQELLVERYRPTRSAEFVAGLELGVLHLGLWMLSLPVRWGAVESLRPAAGALLRIAQWLRPLGSDRGVMVVSVSGTDGKGEPVEATWNLDATGNRGPYVPVLAALALIRRMRDGWRPETGAYACSGVLALPDFEPLLDSLAIRHSACRCGGPARKEPPHRAAA